ncbi:hypothetical protein IKE84_00380 [Candidatus Saccharibacteria bacterium]|nr:hypothetical protein [Candidatus Saccharibacteria bacterium]
MKLRLLQKPSYGIVITPIVFAFSQVVILGYYWIFENYAGNLALTISEYVGLELWSSVFFAICNIFIILLMFRYYLSMRKRMSTAWFILSIIQVVGFIGLSICPHNAFLSGEAREIVSQIHILMAKIMFLAMFGMMFERLRISKFKNTAVTRVCLAFLAYGIAYIICYASNWNIFWNSVLIWESGYIYAFIGALILTRPH